MSTYENTSKHFFNHSPINLAYMHFNGLPTVRSAVSYLFAFKSVPPQLLSVADYTRSCLFKVAAAN